MSARLFFLLFCLLLAACSGRNTGIALGVGTHGAGLALYTDPFFLAPPYAAGAYVGFPDNGLSPGRYEKGAVTPATRDPGPAASPAPSAPGSAEVAPPPATGSSGAAPAAPLVSGSAGVAPMPAPENQNREHGRPFASAPLSPSFAQPSPPLAEPLGEVRFEAPLPAGSGPEL
jgi:hypothetical protein